jgi:hypothetical protein
MSFEEGDRVWLYCPHKKRGAGYKLVRPWTGPYRVLAKVGRLCVSDLVDGWVLSQLTQSIPK